MDNSKRTDWFHMPMHPPVHGGEYEVVIQIDAVTEVEAVATWSHHYGQWGFWHTDTFQTSSRTYLLKVVRWRGRELPHRVRLLPTLEEGNLPPAAVTGSSRRPRHLLNPSD